MENSYSNNTSAACRRTPLRLVFPLHTICTVEPLQEHNLGTEASYALVELCIYRGLHRITYK